MKVLNPDIRINPEVSHPCNNDDDGLVLSISFNNI